MNRCWVFAFACLQASNWAANATERRVFDEQASLLRTFIGASNLEEFDRRHNSYRKWMAYRKLCNRQGNSIHQWLPCYALLVEAKKLGLVSKKGIREQQQGLDRRCIAQRLDSWSKITQKDLDAWSVSSRCRDAWKKFQELQAYQLREASQY